jgi:uncharacterized protein YaiE (UPF0345 family)
MTTRPVLGLCLSALLLAGVPLLGCAQSDLTETSVPADGIALGYDLQAGATFDGHVRRRETISVRGQPMSRSINFTVQLVVNSIDEAGNAKVAAKVSNIELNWVVPGLPVSMNEFNAKAKARLEGVTIRFGVEPSGNVIDIPPTPAELDTAEVEVLDSIIEGLTSAFFVVPEERLTATQGWTNEDTRGREGKLGKFTKDITRGSLAGTYEHRETKQQLAKLEIEGDKTETTTTKDGSSEIRTRSEVTVMWDTKANYMTSISSKMTRTQGAATTTVQFDADWTRSIAGAGAAAASTTGAESGGQGANVQTITDPCDDNYVGPDECLDPCNSNYMGDQPCAEAAAETTGDAGETGEVAPPPEG